LLPQQTIEERLSVAHIQAIAARAGVLISKSDLDYGVDGTFRAVIRKGNRLTEEGYGLDFQLKASIHCQIEPLHIRYDLEVKTYNDLADRHQNQHAMPCILLLKVLSTNEADWLNANEDGVFLGGACYWAYLEGELSSNKESVRIRVPRTKQFTPAALDRLLEANRNYVTTGVWKCE
jgi:Domain of unknown function (DUF4365)